MGLITPFAFAPHCAGTFLFHSHLYTPPPQIQDELRNARREMEAAYSEVQLRNTELDSLEEKLDSVSRELATRQSLQAKMSLSIAESAVSQIPLLDSYATWP